MEYRLPKQGECYRHFKGSEYRVLGIALHTETGEDMVVYEALYGEHQLFVRPLEMFMSKVDKQKFPNVAQEYRFELLEETAIVDEEKQSLLDRFLDLSTHEEKLEFLQQKKEELTTDFLSAVAQSLDFTEKEGDLESRYWELLNYLKTLQKYEGGRLH